MYNKLMNEQSSPSASAAPGPSIPNLSHGANPDLWYPEPEHNPEADAALTPPATREDTYWYPEPLTADEDNSPIAATTPEPTPSAPSEDSYLRFGAGEDAIDDPVAEASLQAAIDAAALRVIGDATGEKSETEAAEAAISSLDGNAVSVAVHELEVVQSEAVTSRDDATAETNDEAVETDPLETVIEDIAERLRQAREQELEEEIERVRSSYIRVIIGRDHRETAYTAQRKMEGIELWEGYARSQISRDRDAMDDTLRAVGVSVYERTDPKVPLNRAVADVMAVMGVDMHGSSDGVSYSKPHDVVGMNPYFYYRERERGDLAAALDRGEVDSPEAVATTERLFQSLVHYGLYKYHKWETASVLTTVFDWMEDFTRRIPDFSPERAGIDEAYSALMADRAVIMLDSRNHPNHDYLPDKLSLRRGAYAALHRIDRIGAIMAIRDQQAAQSDETALTASYSITFAKLSLSQRSSHHFMVTRSPNH